MYQPYPGGAQMPEVQLRPAPPSVLTAVRFMYAGAVASLLGIVAQVNGLQRTLVAGWVVGGLVGAGMWIFIARACKSGKNWARTTGTVFFAVATVDVFSNLAVTDAALAKIYCFAIWLIGLGAVVFFWRASSSAFFTGARP